MTTAVIGLVGVIIGAILTALMNFYLQRAADQHRWEIDERSRLRQDRYQAYTKFIKATQVLAPGEHMSGMSPEELRAIAEGFAETLILASPPVQQAASRLHGAYVRARGLNPAKSIVSKGNQKAEGFTEDRIAILNERFEAFLKAIRDELGVTTLDHEPQSKNPPTRREK
jgi:hypothetical protein